MAYSTQRKRWAALRTLNILIVGKVSAQGIGEIRKFRRREHIILVRILDSMLENATFFDTVLDEKSTPGIENVSYFDYKCKINGKAYSVRLILKKAINDNVRFFYYYKLTGH